MCLLPAMALSLKLISFLFLMTFFSTHIHGRESNFFSKVSSTTTTPFKETTLIPNEGETLVNKQEQDPNFYPETKNAYGLYGNSQESSTEFPTTTKLGAAPTTTTTPTYLPYKTQTETQETYTNYNNDKESNYYNYYNNQYSNNANNYEEQQQNFGETQLQESGYTTTPSTQNNYYNGANWYSNAGKQGMSDTRYFDNGKYYYDVKSETNYSPNQYQNSRINYDSTRANYYSNNNQNSNYNQYNNNNGMYQSEEEFQDEQHEP